MELDRVIPATRLRPGTYIRPHGLHDPAEIIKVEPVGLMVGVRTADGRTTVYKDGQHVRTYR